MKSQTRCLQSEIVLARAIWGKLSKQAVQNLKGIAVTHQLSVASGDILYIDGHWYVSHAGLLRLARRNHCAGIRVHPVREYCDPAAGRWAFKATVYKSLRCKGFVGFGDADPSNVSSLVRGAEMRVAETRAVNRALRKAYGIGICSVEEIGALSARHEAARPPKPSNGSPGKGIPVNGNGNGQPRLRDRLCQLIRQHKLDPGLVKRYAADFCGTEALRDASRELVEDFVHHLEEQASKDREGLLCQLNSYSPAPASASAPDPSPTPAEPQEVKP
jgi:hypothetical protein